MDKKFKWWEYHKDIIDDLMARPTRPIGTMMPEIDEAEGEAW